MQNLYKAAAQSLVMGAALCKGGDNIRHATVLASPEQAKIITALENDGMSHVALISRGNEKVADQLLALQDTVLTEIYLPEPLEAEQTKQNRQRLHHEVR